MFRGIYISPTSAIVSSSLLARFVLGVIVILTLAPVTNDEIYRIFLAHQWTQTNSFASSSLWLPGFEYICGLTVGIWGDMAVAPRFLGLLPHMAASVLLVHAASLRSQKNWILLLALGLPLSWTMGSTALSEPVFALVVIGAIEILRRHSCDENPWTLLAAAGLYLFATMIRYEAWVLLPLYTWIVMRARPRQLSAFGRGAIALMPWFFPLLWLLMQLGLQGDPFYFLRHSSIDLFGGGSPDALLSPGSLYVSVLPAGFGAVAVALRAAQEDWSRGVRLERWIYELHFIVALAAVCLLTISGNLPSELISRVFYFPTLLSVPSMAWLLDRWLGRKRWVLYGPLFFAGFAACGTAFAYSLPHVVGPVHDETAQELKRIVSRSSRGGDEKLIALIEKVQPEGVVVYVRANDPDHVKLDMYRKKLRGRLLHCVSPLEFVPHEGPEVVAAAVYSEVAKKMLVEKNWRKVDVFGRWQVYEKGAMGTSVYDRSVCFDLWPGYAPYTMSL